MMDKLIALDPEHHYWRLSCGNGYGYSLYLVIHENGASRTVNGAGPTLDGTITMALTKAGYIRTLPGMP